MCIIVYPQVDLEEKRAHEGNRRELFMSYKYDSVLLKSMTANWALPAIGLILIEE
jgi:hypothetical protein